MRSRAVIAVAIALGLVGCGASSLSASQLRTGATRICRLSERRTAQIPTPTLASAASRYLRGGILVLTPELTRLRALHPPADVAGPYLAALQATGAEVGALRFARKRLDSGEDPLVAVKSLEQLLRPLEARADRAWSSVGAAPCIAG
jgi:hypothetical protein